ncbi:glyoxalase [Adhaeribacter swui]|uniref:Glyoxalase n=1 Tax=Adhaeribacter swui TaxID=2086471 RepID=A0A7G7GAG6_9BACT|nr:VOC family protein [Adhaeribacter swui]QNF34150.1 glyoxalase [Adhaeribacter swui]
MNYTAKTIRTFIGAKDYNRSRAFYRDLDFEEVVIGDKMCLFRVNENLGFYLQDYDVADWIDNSMVFLEVDDIEKCAESLLHKNLQSKYPEVKFTEIKQFDWGRELFMTDPAGVLWHFGEFKK